MTHTEQVIETELKNLSIPIHYTNRSFVIRCPQCSKADKLYIEKATGRTICFSCNLKANAPYIIHLLTGMTMEAARDILSWGEVVQKDIINTNIFSKMTIADQAIVDPVIHFSPAFQRVDGNDPGSKYAESRGIQLKYLKALDCRYNLYDKRLIFPVYNIKHELIGYQGRDWTGQAELKALSSSFNRSGNVLGIQLVPTNSPVAICEGPFDMLRIMPFMPAVCTFGKIVSRKQVELIMSLNPSKVYICLDNDAQLEASQLAFMIGSKAYISPPPNPYKDYGETPPDEIKTALESAKQYSPLSFIPNLFK